MSQLVQYYWPTGVDTPGHAVALAQLGASGVVLPRLQTPNAYLLTQVSGRYQVVGEPVVTVSGMVGGFISACADFSASGAWLLGSYGDLTFISNLGAQSTYSIPTAVSGDTWVSAAYVGAISNMIGLSGAQFAGAGSLNIGNHLLAKGGGNLSGLFNTITTAVTLDSASLVIPGAAAVGVNITSYLGSTQINAVGSLAAAGHSLIKGATGFSGLFGVQAKAVSLDSASLTVYSNAAVAANATLASASGSFSPDFSSAFATSPSVSGRAFSNDFSLDFA